MQSNTSVIHCPDGTSFNADWKCKIGKYYNSIHLGVDEFEGELIEGEKVYPVSLRLDYESSESLSAQYRYIMIWNDGDKLDATSISQLELWKHLEKGVIKVSKII